jgi:TonB family protein
MNDVTDILRDRMQPPDGLQQMAAVSALAHAAVLAVIVLLPGALMPSRSNAVREVMSISLNGGSAGTDTGGMTPMGGRAVQTQAPPEAPKRPEPIRAPAAKTPEMTVPTPTAKPAPKTPPVTQAPAEARGRTPTKGETPTPGSTIAETGVRGQGFGLATGGGTGAGSRLDISGDFCCPEYLGLMTTRIRTNWNDRAERPGETIIVFTIERDGTLTNIAIERGGVYANDIAALRAVTQTRQLPPLPAGFPNPSLTVHLNFQYTR